MNASQSVRSSYRASWVPSPAPAAGVQRSISKAGKTSNPPQPSASSQQRSRRASIIDWSEWKVERAQQDVHEAYEVPRRADDPATFVDQLFRMFTIFPVRDMNWVVAIAFVVGSVVFTIGAFFQLSALLYPDDLFPLQLELGVPLCTAIGALMFLTAGVCAIIVALNADRGEFEVRVRDPEAGKKNAAAAYGGEKTVDLEAAHVEDAGEKVYKPALLGDKNWMWWPSSWSREVKPVVSQLPFRLGLMQMLGGVVLSISVAPGFPGVLDPADPVTPMFVVFAPLTFGSCFFILANFILMIQAQDHWYAPKIGTANWEAAFWSLLGSIGFMLTGAYLFLGDPADSTWANFLGSIAFLIGAVVQWYDLMAFHPDGWAC